MSNQVKHICGGYFLLAFRQTFYDKPLRKPQRKINKKRSKINLRFIRPSSFQNLNETETLSQLSEPTENFYEKHLHQLWQHSAVNSKQRPILAHILLWQTAAGNLSNLCNCFIEYRITNACYSFVRCKYIIISILLHCK